MLAEGCQEQRVLGTDREVWEGIRPQRDPPCPGGITNMAKRTKQFFEEEEGHPQRDSLTRG